MVPPPDNTGDEFPDFENMSFEEQMAWLESLAKRQGAGEDELTTAADLDVPVPDDVEVDEPGYIPFEGSRSAREMQAAASSMPSPSLSDDEDEGPVASPQDEPEMVVEASSDEIDYEEEPPVTEDAVPEVMGKGDPMQWLDSLAVQPDDEDEVAEMMDDLFDDDADVEPEPEIFAGAELTEHDEPEIVEDVAGAELAPAAASDDPLGGMDPMLWLESLAARQGANISELTTAADLQIDDVGEDTVIDEPGYVPFEGSRSAREAAMSASAEQEVDIEAEAEEELVEPVAEETISEPELEFEDVSGAADIEEELPELFAEEPETEAELDLADLFGADEAEEAEAMVDETVFEDVTDGAGSMEWLESLAKRQGARDEELLTPADVDVPEMPADTVVDEPGYVEYSPLSILPPEQPREELEDVDELADVAEFEDATADSGLSWLEDLAAEPEQDVADFLAFEDEVVARHADEAEAAESLDDPLAGMSDDDIARAQAQGTLTPQQELAWLKRQARALADTREAEQMAMSDEELPPAEPGEIPDWLETIRQTSEQEVMTLAEDVLDEPAIEGGELPDWLQEPEEDEAALEEDAFVEVSLDGDVESLWGEEPATSEASDLDQVLPDSELAAFVSGDYSVSEPDALAEALDEEYERIQSGDESEPEWYTAAVEKVSSETADSTEPESEEAASEPVLAEAEPVESPGWLDDIVEEDEVPETVAADADDDMPDWLRGVDESAAVAITGDDMPDWLTEVIEEPVEVAGEGMPDWLTEIDEDLEAPEPEFVSEAEPSPEEEKPVEAIPAIEVAKKAPPAPVVPEGEVYEQYRERLESNPVDHTTRLALARALKSNQSVDSALEQYEALIEAAEMLPDVSDDLTAMVEAQPEQPRAQRLLGDSYMRRGMLSEALDAYRNALHQL